MTRTWIAAVRRLAGTPRPPRPAAARPAARPRLLALEDRAVPAAFYGTPQADNIFLTVQANGSVLYQRFDAAMALQASSTVASGELIQLFAGDGNDAVSVTSVGGLNTLSLVNEVQVNAGPGSDTLAVYKLPAAAVSAATAGVGQVQAAGGQPVKYVVGASSERIESLGLNAATGGMALTVTDRSVSTYVNGGAGKDTLTVSHLHDAYVTAAAVGVGVVADASTGGGGNVQYAAAGTAAIEQLELNGSALADVIRVVDRMVPVVASGGGGSDDVLEVHALRDAAVTGLVVGTGRVADGTAAGGQPVDYRAGAGVPEAFEALRLFGTAADDVLQVFDPTLPVALSGGAGADLLNAAAGVPATYFPGAADGKRVQYLNFDGASITPAQLLQWSGNNTDWPANGLDLNNDGIAVQAFLGGAGNREDVIGRAMRLVHEDYRPFDVDVVRHAGLAVTGQGATTLFVGPATIEYFDGTEVQVHSPASPKLRGIASSLDFGNDDATDIGFTLLTYDGGTAEQMAQYVANTSAHEAGHTYGLAHINRLTSGTGGYNELMRGGTQTSELGNATYNYGFLDRALPRTDTTGPDQNSYRALKANLQGIGSPPPGQTGTIVPLDTVGGGGGAGADTYGGCGCPLCRSAADALAAATPVPAETASVAPDWRPTAAPAGDPAPRPDRSAPPSRAVATDRGGGEAGAPAAVGRALAQRPAAPAGRPDRDVAPGGAAREVELG